MEAALLVFCLAGTLSAFPILQEENSFTGSGDDLISNVPAQSNYEVSVMLLGVPGGAVGSGDGAFQRRSELNSSSFQNVAMKALLKCGGLPERAIFKSAVLAKWNRMMKTVEIFWILLHL
ncbi:hypothetical protein AGOR_G00232960 [Albula goreensis]|uniref:Uncharacterized protein n=1 Tax=Albula goreensis TaxID=1534307 RepID=A0A8T3CJD3_9TELE|nr:hypothetical protein AGOR_G00232960 [Albula goreensis]